MKILITGGGGFLGTGIVPPLTEHGLSLRLMDVHPFDSPHEVFVGDVRNLGAVREAVQGMDALIIAHMAPRDPDSYATPEVAFDINVKGAANLFVAAAEAGVRRVVLMSSVATLDQYGGPLGARTLPACDKGVYGLTKVCQEAIAKRCAHEHNMAVAALRVGYLVETEHMQDKYGRTVGERAALDTDPVDVAEVTHLWLEGDYTGYEVFSLMSTHEALTEWNLQYTCDRLNWQPRYAFDRLPLPGEKD